jgi:hypothetical protein
MKTVLASATAILIFSVPALSQSTGTAQPNAAGADQGNVPESMRIQQQVTKKNLADPRALTTKGGATTTDAPGAAAPPVEQNRLDPSAPSRQRLQIDEGASARAVQNPSADAANRGGGGNFNTIIEGAPSSSGTSSGASGAGSSSTGVLTSPSGSTTPSVSPSISSGVSGSSGAGTSGGAGGASSSSGSSGGGASGGGGSH